MNTRKQARRLIVGALGALALSATACSSPEQETAEQAKQTSPAAARTFERIEHMTDCAKLQAAFDRAMTNAEARPPGHKLRDLSMSYADAAIKRMDKVKCA